MNPSISIRYDDIELRGSMNTFDIANPVYTQEIIHWIHPDNDKQYNYTIAQWKRNSEGYNLVYVGSRPFDIPESTAKHFHHLAMMGQQIINYIYVHGGLPQ